MNIYSKAARLHFTYGVLERVRNLLLSAGVEESKKMERIMSDLRVAYPLIYSKFSFNGEYEYEYEVMEEYDTFRRGVFEINELFRRMRQIAYYIEHMFDAAATDQLGLNIRAAAPQTGGSLANSIERLREILTELLEICDLVDHPRTWTEEYSKSKFGVYEVIGASSRRYYGQLWSLPEDATIVGRESEQEKIIHWIFNVDDIHYLRHKVISIYGEAGVGKITLAKMIYNDVGVSTSFSLLSWVLFPRPTMFSSLQGVLVEIIRSFTNQSRFHLQRMGEEKLRRKLRGILEDQKYLLVLDMSRERDSWIRGWEKLMEIFDVGSAGSTVIVVSQWTCSSLSATKTLYLEGLAEEQCWSLFARSAGFDEEVEKKHPSFLTSIGRSLVDGCLRCPLAIKTLGSMLRTNRDEHYWMQIKDSKMWNKETIHERDSATAAFIISLEHMSADLLQCLYYSFILSNKNRIIPKDQLLFSWMALGLLHSSDEKEDPMDIGDRHCIELVARCFFQSFQSDGRPMVLLHNHAASLPELLGEKFDNRLYSFLEERIYEMKNARVVLFEGDENGELPEDIGNLRLLRYLSLAGNRTLEQLPDSIGNLLNLQTLDLSGCKQLQKLPQNMHKLVSLRHLFLSLNLTDVPETALNSWTLLHHLRICDSPNLNSLPEEIANLTILKVLQIHNCPSIASLPSSIKCLTSLKELSILNCAILDLTNWNGLEGLRDLQYLQVQGLPNLSKFPEGLESAADSLQHLVVSNCQSLTALPEGLQNCINLVEIVIESCPYMGTLPKGILEIKTLQILKIINSPAFKGVEYHDQLVKEVENSVSKARISSQRASQEFSKAKASQELSKDKEVLTKERKDPCFILFLLPEDYEIDKDTLIQLWMATECIKDELHGDKCFSTVLDEGYLLYCGTNFMTGKDRYRINANRINELLDSVKDDACHYLQWKKEFQNNTMAVESVQHVSLGCTIETDAATFETLEKFKELRTLLFLGNHNHNRVIQMPRHLFSSFSKLEALDLSRSYMKELPSTIGDMIHLRYLDLSWTVIEWLPEILCSLTELQTLKLRECCNLSVLPEQFKELTKLRHLDVDVLGQLEVMPKGIGALEHLRTLPAFLVGTEDGCKIKELEKLNNLSGELCVANLENVVNAYEAKGAALSRKHHIEKLELRWTASEICGMHHNSYAILENLEPSTNMAELDISCYEGSSIPAWIEDTDYYKLVSILFYRCENLLEFPVIEQLPNLKHLELVRMNSVKIIGGDQQEQDDVAFPKLEKLEINGMQSLEVWDWKKSNEGDFRSLTHLIIEDCPELQKFDVLPHLPSINYFEIRNCPKLQSLSDRIVPRSLQELIVDDCPPIQKKCIDGGEDWHKIEHVPNISI